MGCFVSKQYVLIKFVDNVSNAQLENSRKKLGEHGYKIKTLTLTPKSASIIVDHNDTLDIRVLFDDDCIKVIELIYI